MQRPMTWPIMIGRKPPPFAFGTAPMDACVATRPTSGAKVWRSAAYQPARSVRMVRGRSVAARAHDDAGVILRIVNILVAAGGFDFEGEAGARAAYFQKRIERNDNVIVLILTKDCA